VTDKEIEERVIDILVKSGNSHNALAGPIHEVDSAMHWASADTQAFVNGLHERGLIVKKMSAFQRMELGQAIPLSEQWWERPIED
jgi:hypothetical protein